jgi:hypothetical protein
MIHDIRIQVVCAELVLDVFITEVEGAFVDGWVVEVFFYLGIFTHT